MPSSRRLITSTTLSTSAASVTFSSIPATYTDLVLRISARAGNTGTSANFTLAVSLNGNSATNHSYTVLRATGSTVNSFAGSSVTNINGVTSATAATANTFGNAEFYIPNYTSSANKPCSFFSVAEDNTTSAAIRATAGLYSSSSAVSSIVIWSQSGYVLDSGSSFYLYGLFNS
jgi:hypothetical protein